MGLFFSCCRNEDDITSSEIMPLYIPLLTKPMLLIGITGKAGSGKDTLADYLVESYGFQKKSFAGPLKRGISELFSIPLDSMYDPIEKEQVNHLWNKSPRELMQWLGTDILRKHIRDDFFLASIANELNNCDAHRVVITDVRFDNEAEYLSYIGAPIIKIDSGIRETITQLGKNESKHRSEKGISERLIDFTIMNDLGIDDLKQTFDSVVAEQLNIL